MPQEMYLIPISEISEKMDDQRGNMEVLSPFRKKSKNLKRGFQELLQKAPNLLNLTSDTWAG